MGAKEKLEGYFVQMGLTYQQIADTMRITDRTVRRYMAQAFEQCLLLAA